MKLSSLLGLGTMALLVAAEMPAATTTNNLGSLTGSTTVMGTLANQGDLVEEMFTLPTTSNLTAYTTSYASGNFQPNLALFDSTGNQPALANETASPIATPDSTTGVALDAYLTTGLPLAAGQYTLVLMDIHNMSDPGGNGTLQAGFVNTGSGGTTFSDILGNARTGNAYSLTLDASAVGGTTGGGGGTSATPEPGSAFLVLAGLGAALMGVRKFRVGEKNV